jgi:4-amino-4-deoxy-L-arabinose transferase-like glycosyltransferase
MTLQHSVAKSLRTAPTLVIAAAVLPRLAILLNERGSILTAFTEKSDDFARQFVHSGTFGFVPGQPSAWTQPLYAWFLIPIYWIFGRSWWAVGLIQIGVAVGTALLVYELGRRFVSKRVGLVAAVVATLNPYLVWHDVHENREILDQFLAVAIVLLVMILAGRRSLWLSAVLGVTLGLAILGNTRLLFLPILCCAFVVGRERRTWAVPWPCCPGWFGTASRSGASR